MCYCPETQKNWSQYSSNFMFRRITARRDMNGVTGMTTTSDVALVGCNSIASESLKRLLSEEHRRIIYAGPSVEELRRSGSTDAAFLLILMEDQHLKWKGAALAAAHQQHPAAKIVILATEFDYDAMLGAFRAGVQGYLTNDLPWERLAGYLDLIAFGEKIFPSQLAERLIGENMDGIPSGGAATIDSVNLSAREMEILQRLISGLPNKIISRQLCISESTSRQCCGNSVWPIGPRRPSGRRRKACRHWVPPPSPQLRKGRQRRAAILP
jgi:two-component system nitrate/nitrite response regulator NarL